MSLQDIVSDADTLPFGFDKKVLVIKNPYFLSSSKEPKLSFEVSYDEFINFLKQDNPDSMIVLSFVGEIDNRKSLVKTIKGYAKVYEISDIEKNEWNVIAKRLFNEMYIRSHRAAPRIRGRSATATVGNDSFGCARTRHRCGPRIKSYILYHTF